MEDQTKITQALAREAVAAGIVDLEGVRFVDMSNVGLNHRGDVVGAKKAIADLKAAKPLFFEKPFSVKDATPEEVTADAKRRGLTIKRY